MPTLASSDNYRPGQIAPATKSRLERFQTLNAWITRRGGWITSLPGADTVTIEVLPGSFLLTEMAEAGYQLEPAGHRERLIPGQITQRLQALSDGTLRAISSDSSAPCALTVTHAGCVTVDCYEFAF